jgi:flagellar biogenesis protein FliO
MLFLAQASTLGEAFGGTGGGNVWQSLGGLALVFGLLVICLKLLGRLNRTQKSGKVCLLKVWPLGPKREIQVLRLEAVVHYIYRHDGAMVLLKEEPFEQWEMAQATAETGQTVPNKVGALLQGLRS